MRHGGRSNYVFGDGRAETLDPNLIRATSQPAGGPHPKAPTDVMPLQAFRKKTAHFRRRVVRASHSFFLSCLARPSAWRWSTFTTRVNRNSSPHRPVPPLPSRAINDNQLDGVRAIVIAPKGKGSDESAHRIALSRKMVATVKTAHGSRQQGQGSRPSRAQYRRSFPKKISPVHPPSGFSAVVHHEHRRGGENHGDASHQGRPKGKSPKSACPNR